MHEPVIVSAVRTPTGRFLGALKDFTATQLGAMVVAEAVRRAGIDRCRCPQKSCAMLFTENAANSSLPAQADHGPGNRQQGPAYHSGSRGPVTIPA